MYIYVIITEKEDYCKTGPDAFHNKIKARLEQISGDPCLIVPFEEFCPALVAELNPRAIVVSGFSKALDAFKVESFYGLDEVLHAADIPAIGLCGGHQLFAYFFNGSIREMTRLADQPMRKLDPLEDTPRHVSYHPDYFYANGFYPVTKVKEDPIFEGLPEVMFMQCWHYCEVKQLSKSFELLASTGHCGIEAMKHKVKPIYGVQFHPEAYEDPFFDGRTLLENFAKITESVWNEKKGQP